MHSLRQKVTVPESHEVTIRVPSDVPPGEAEIIVMVESLTRSPADPPFAEWLTAWVKSLPPAPAIPLEALRRENLYE